MEEGGGDAANHVFDDIAAGEAYLEPVQRERVLSGKDPDRFDPELGARTKDPDCNLATVGDQHLFERFGYFEL